MRWLAIALVFTIGCEKKDKQSGLPPAQEWGADPGAALNPAPQPPRGANPHGGSDPSNPHAGVDMNNPHAGVDMNSADTSNPHAGIDMSGDPSNPHANMGAVDMNNPHAGMDMNGSPDVAKLGLPPPDPNRPIDPTHHVKGVIKINPKAADKVKPGTAVFVIVKKADASGQPTGTPLAVDKLTWQKDELAFEVTEHNAMIAGTQLVGDVVITARYDQDGDALSKQAGDIVGQMKVTVPAESVKLFLDQVLP